MTDIKILIEKCVKNSYSSDANCFIYMCVESLRVRPTYFQLMRTKFYQDNLLKMNRKYIGQLVMKYKVESLPCNFRNLNRFCFRKTHAQWQRQILHLNGKRRIVRLKMQKIVRLKMQVFKEGVDENIAYLQISTNCPKNDFVPLFFVSPKNGTIQTRMTEFLKKNKFRTPNPHSAHIILIPRPRNFRSTFQMPS